MIRSPVQLEQLACIFPGLLGAADKVLGMGMSFTTRLEVDAALAAAEAAYCAYITK